MNRMMPYEKLLPAILPQTLPCPRSIALDAVQMIAMDFFTESGVWIETAESVVCCCDTDISLPLPKGAVLHAVTEVSLNGEKLDKDEYETDRQGIILKQQQSGMITAQCALRPKRFAMEMPEDLLEEFGDFLVYGALSRLKGMSGNKVEWSDPKGAAYYGELYQDGLSRAKLRKFRRRFGANLLYVQTDEV